MEQTQNIDKEDILKYNEKFNQKKIIQIKNILSNDFAEEIYKYIFIFYGTFIPCIIFTNVFLGFIPFI